MNKLTKILGSIIAGLVVVTGWAMLLPQYFPYESLVRLFYYFM